MNEFCPNCGLNKALCEVFTNLLGDPCVKETDVMEIELKELRDSYDYITARCTDLAVELHEVKKERDALISLLRSAVDMLHDCGLRDEIFAELEGK